MALQNAFENMGTESTSDKVVILLNKILTRLPFQTPAGEMRASITNGTVSTVSTVSNQTSLGGFQAPLMLMGTTNLGAHFLRSHIVVS